MKREQTGPAGELLAGRSVDAGSGVMVDRVTDRSQVSNQPGILKRMWRGWLKFAEVLGTIQMVIILSLVYWVLLAMVAIPFRLFADPLALRHPHSAGWTQRQPVSQSLESMKNQY